MVAVRCLLLCLRHSVTTPRLEAHTTSLTHVMGCSGSRNYTHRGYVLLCARCMAISTICGIKDCRSCMPTFAPISSVLLFCREFRGPVTAVASFDGALLLAAGHRLERHELQVANRTCGTLSF